MERTITIKNLLAFEDAEFDIGNGATLITGENSSGKTSLARILAALVTHHNNPAGLAVGDAKFYLHGNSAEGIAKISDGANWRGSIKDSGIAVPEGQEPESTEHAVGLVDFCPSAAASDRKRAELFEHMFLPDNVLDILKPFWLKMKLPENQLLHVVARIEKEGWNVAQKLYTDQKRGAKQRWSEITGQAYGSNKATTWKPSDWETDLEGQSAEDMDEQVSLAVNALEALTRKAVIDEHQIEEAETARDETIPALKEELASLRTAKDEAAVPLANIEQNGKDAGEEIERLGKTISEFKQKIAGLKNVKAPEKPPTIKCPSCDTELLFSDGKLSKYVEQKHTPPDNSATIKQYENDIATWEATKADLEKSKAELTEEYKAKKATFQDAEAKFNVKNAEIVALQKKVEAFAGKKTSAGMSEAEKSQAQNAKDKAVSRRAAWKAEMEARKAHENVIELEAIEHLLSPAGARAEHMKEPMEKLNKKLAAVCKKAGWLPIHVSEAYHTYSGGLPTRITAENEQKKVQWAFQIALGVMDEAAKWIILDAADLLRGDSWDGLVKVVDFVAGKYTDKYVVVCATETEAPDGWAKIELGEG